MKYYLGQGAYLDSEKTPTTRHHKRITATAHIPGTRAGTWAILECGHRAQMFGEFDPTRGFIACTICRDSEEIGAPGEY